MGMYTKGEFYLLAKTEEAAERFADEIRNLETIKGNVRNIDHLMSYELIVHFDSGRFANAEYVIEEVERMAKEKFTSEEIEELSAELSTPENYLYLTDDDFVK